MIYAPKPVEGKGLVQLEGRDKIAFQAGEHVYIPENVSHHRGAIEGEHKFIHLAVTAGVTHLPDDPDPRADLIKLNQKILEAEEEGDEKAKENLEPILAEGFYIGCAKGNKQNRQDFLKALPENAHLGRSAEEPEVQIFGDCAVYTCRVTTLRKPDGTEITRQFWNTRFFIKEEGKWRCQIWQVIEIPQF